MSDSENDELDFLAYSGSEYEPSLSGGDSDVSSFSDVQDDSDSSDNQGADKKRKRTRHADGKRRKLPARNLGRNGVAKRTNVQAASTNNGCTTYKTFGEFMNDVVFSLSGFVNPLRSDLRLKALAMGAQYSPDWNDRCTHLICAFCDTPKYHQVRGSGKIVNKEWIEDCYSSRKRFPWRRYAIDRRDRVKNESEDEIYELSSAVSQDFSQESANEDDSVRSTVTDVDEVFSQNLLDNSDI